MRRGLDDSWLAIALSAAVLPASFVPAADCNQNGLDDVRDLAPRRIYSPRFVDESLRFVEAMDFDGDGDADLVGAGESLHVLANAGAGELTQAVAVETGGVVEDAAIADFDGDGDFDIALASFLQPGVAVLLQTVLLQGVRAGFQGGGVVSLFEAPLTLSASDFDRDGDLDLLASERNRGSLVVLWNQGAAAFVAGVEEPLGARVLWADAGDLDGDGDADAAALLASPQVQVSVRLDVGPGGSTAGVRLAANPNAVHLALPDLDGDGDLDLIVANGGSTTISLFQGDGKAGFAAAEHLPAVKDHVPVRVLAADLDADGVADLISSGSSATGTAVYLAQAPGKLAAGRGYPRPAMVAAAADFDGDGRLDVAGGGKDSRILFGDGRGALGGVSRLNVPSEALALAAGDLDGDEDLDLLVANGSSSGLWIFLTVAGETQEGRFVSAAAAPWWLGLADGNADGSLDLVTLTRDEDNLRTFVNDGKGSFGPRGKIAVPADAALALGDLNGDGRGDVAVAASFSVLILVSRADGSLALERTLPSGADPAAIAAADFNGDGVADLVTANFLDDRNFPSDNVSLSLNDGGGRFLQARHYAVDREPSSLAVEDFDGDGLLDLAVAHGSANGVTLLGGDGGGKLSQREKPLMVFSWDSMQGGDFDGDGRPDLVLANVSTHQLWVLRNPAGAAAFQLLSVAVGQYPAQMDAADWNGDGDDELLVACSASHYVGIVDVFQPPASRDVNGNSVPDECEARFRRADADANGSLEVTDAVFILALLFRSGEPPGCSEAADVQADGRLDLSDAVYLLAHLFAGGPDPPAPFPDCGPAAAALLGCETPPAGCAPSPAAAR